VDSHVHTAKELFPVLVIVEAVCSIVIRGPLAVKALWQRKIERKIPVRKKEIYRKENERNIYLAQRLYGKR
jgi:hypothetical protein